MAKYCALSLEFMNLLQQSTVYLAVLLLHLAVIEYLYRGSRAVPRQTFTTRHDGMASLI